MVMHIQALFATLGMLFAMLLWIKGAMFSGFLASIAAVVLSYVLMRWVYECWQIASPVSRQGILWGAFGIGMFLFSYAMVPLYHLVCHGSGTLSPSRGSHALDVNIIVQNYRSLPINIIVSDSMLSLKAHDEQLIYITLENKSSKTINTKLSVASMPRTLKPAFDLVVPDEIHLEPWQKTSFPVAVNFKGEVPEDLWQSALLFVFQDTNNVGRLGKTQSWQKMQGKGYKDGVL